jgi:hypothetical protein
MTIDLPGLMLNPYEAGYSSISLSGRSIYDLALIPNSQSVCQLIDILRTACRQRGLHLITFCPLGLDAGTQHLSDRDRATLEKELNRHSLLVRADDSEEQLMRSLRGLAELAKSPPGERQWSDGKTMNLCILLEFGQHILPTQNEASNHNDLQILAAELLHTAAQSVALNSGNNYIIVHTADCTQLDPLVASVLRPVRLPQPDEEEKAAFLTAAISAYPDASFVPGVDIRSASNLSSRTANRSSHQLVVESHLLKRPITPLDLFQQKQRDVAAQSEGTLRLLDTRRIQGITLHGSNVRVVQKMLGHFSSGLLRGDTKMPCNICLCGPPSTGKTELALQTAVAAGVPAFELISAKSGIVGETERKARLQQQLLADYGGVVFADELTEILPTQRNEFDGDSGASRAVGGALLQGLSDTSRQGHLLFIGATNTPWRIGEALRSRFLFIPVLRATKSDYPLIVATLAQRIDSSLQIDLSDPGLLRSAYSFYEKLASPREILSALQVTRVLLGGKFDLETIEHAAANTSSVGDLRSIIHCELAAIQACPLDSFLPWADDPMRYDWPDYLEGIVDKRTGKVDRGTLSKRCAELAEVSNV